MDETQARDRPWESFGVSEKQWKDLQYRAKLELCRRDFWEFCKIAIIPVCIWYLQKQITLRDERREREYQERRQEQVKQQKQNADIQFLMMQRLDKLSEMTHLMARKLHDQGIINGDLEALDTKYKELDDEYEKEVHRLALSYSKK